MARTLPEALANLAVAAQTVIDLVAQHGVHVPNVPVSHGGQWSRRMRTSEAAAILSISGHALRRRIRAHAGPGGTAVFDGICAERLGGGRYLVRLSRRWLTEPDAERAASDLPTGR